MELQECFECTDWDLFKNTCSDLDVLTDTVSSYISFCENMVIPCKTCVIFPNNKPWISKSLKYLLTLNHAVWKGIKSMLGMQNSDKGVSLPNMSEAELAKQLNTFYTRFDSVDFNDELSHFRNGPAGFKIKIDQATVCKSLSHINERRRPGPDGLGGKLLKRCAWQLSGIFSHIGQTSLEQQRAPRIWKESIVVPVAKVRTPKTLNNYHPVASTCLVMKSFAYC